MSLVDATFEYEGAGIAGAVIAINDAALHFCNKSCRVLLDPDREYTLAVMLAGNPGAWISVRCIVAGSSRTILERAAIPPDSAHAFFSVQTRF